MTQVGVPPGLRLAADAGLRRTDGGRLLIGGAPLRLVRVSEVGAAIVEQWIGGAPVAADAAERRLARRLLDAGMLHPVIGPVDRVDVTVVVPVRDGATGLDRCLASAGPHPVVVVDDGSADADAIRRVTEAHGARLVRRDVCGGPGVARNAGVARVDTPLVAFLDADVEASSGWIEALAGHLVDPAVAAVAPRVRSGDGSSILRCYEEVHSPLDLGPAPSPVGPARPVAYVPTAAFLVRADALREVGGFDPELRRGEDVDLVWRLVDAGHTVRYEPGVEVVHEPRPTWRAWLAQRRGYGATAAPLAKRHGAKVAPARCSAWSAVAWGAVATGHPVVGVGVAAGTTAALARRLDGVPEPLHEAVRLAGPGHLYAGVGLARALSRVWWPLAVGAAIVCPRLRWAVAAAMVGPAALDWVRGPRPADAARSVALGVADDVAYGVGVWEGVIRGCTVAPLLPELTEWPGRQPAVETGTVGGR